MLSIVVLASALSGVFSGLPQEISPETVSRRITDQFLSTRPENYYPAGYHGNKGYGWNKTVQYSVVSLWVNALECARLAGDEKRLKRLVDLFEDFKPNGRLFHVCSRPYHVDDSIFGALPLEIYLQTGESACLEMGAWYADTQWSPPCWGTYVERHNAPREKQAEYYALGYSPQTRLWIDDMYMITVLQSQAYRATGERTYIERAAKEMAFYLDNLQLKEGPAAGLFYHAPDVPFVWGRGDGWMAAGMALVLDRLPEDSPHRARIMEGYRLMMATLLKYQRPDGLWCQLVDRPDDARNWGETSATAMFAYAYLVGIRHDWLEAATYGAAARKAWESLCARLDEHANLADVCEGTGKKDDLVYYYERGRVNGDPHGQAPMLWLCGELLKDRGATPETSPLFVRHVDDGSGVVSYVLRPGLVDHNQQSMYFTHKSMTDDGRFLVFWAAGDEREKPARDKETYLLDFHTGRIVKLPGPGGEIPFLDTERDALYFIDGKGVHRFDFLGGNPATPVLVCALPPELADGKVGRYCTHLTLSHDRTKCFLDAELRDSLRNVQGVLDLATGKWTQWGETPFLCNHGQIHPFDAGTALCAWEGAWNLAMSELTVEQRESERRKQKRPGLVSGIPRPKGEPYPRVWIMRKDGSQTMIPPRIGNYASHEAWTADGRGVYWCGKGVVLCDVETGDQRLVMPLPAQHATMSADLRYVAFDQSTGGWWRGCAWTCGFWNRETNRSVFIHTKTPVYLPKESESHLHPDPHPQFVCRDRYVVSTLLESGRMNLAITPVEELVRLTSGPAKDGTP